MPTLDSVLDAKPKILLERIVDVVKSGKLYTSHDLYTKHQLYYGGKISARVPKLFNIEQHTPTLASVEEL